MRDFINHFVRESGGTWKCVSPTETATVMGRIQVAEGSRFTPGTVFMGCDIVGLLEEEHERLQSFDITTALTPSVACVASLDQAKRDATAQ